MTHISVSDLTIIDSDNDFSPSRHKAIIWTNAEILLIGPLGTNFSENLVGILTFSVKKIRLKVSSAKWRPFCLGLNVLSDYHNQIESLNTVIIHSSVQQHPSHYNFIFHWFVFFDDAKNSRWVRSRRCGCLVTWFCYHLIAKSGNKTAAPSWPDPDPSSF